MSEDTSSKTTSSNIEDTPLTRSKAASLSEHEETDTVKQPKRIKSEAQKLQQDTIAALNLDSNILNTGSRLLRSQRTLLHTDNEAELKNHLNNQG